VGEKEILLKIDKKGRVLIPAHVRKKLGFKHIIRAIVEERKLVLEPIQDPLEELTSTVLEGTEDVEQQIFELRKRAENEARKKVKARWS